MERVEAEVLDLRKPFCDEINYVNPYDLYKQMNYNLVKATKRKVCLLTAFGYRQAKCINNEYDCEKCFYDFWHSYNSVFKK